MTKALKKNFLDRCIKINHAFKDCIVPTFVPQFPRNGERLHASLGMDIGQFSDRPFKKSRDIEKIINSLFLNCTDLLDMTSLY